MLPILLSLIGCDRFVQSCNLMYAPDMLTLEITASDLDGEVIVIAESDGYTPINCSVPAGEQYGTCDDLSSNIEVSGSTIRLSLWEYAPADVTLQVEVVDAWAEQVSLAPTYTEDEPNGEGCGYRSSGQEQIAL